MSHCPENGSPSFLTQRGSWPSMGRNRTACKLFSGVEGAGGFRFVRAVKVNSGVRSCAAEPDGARIRTVGLSSANRHWWELLG